MKRKRILKVFLSMFIAIGCISALPVHSVFANNITITDESQLEVLFPDVYFRDAVFSKVKNGKDGATGTDIKDALSNFTGDIVAKNKGIKNITGIDLLRKANKVDLTGNEISDFSHLGKNVAASDKESKEWYGIHGSTTIDLDARDEGRNVHWILNKNPFEMLPVDFGGCLTIDQPAKSSYTYPTPTDGSLSYVFLRDLNQIGAVSGKMNIAKSKIMDGTNNGNGRNAEVISVGVVPHPGDTDRTLKIKKWQKGNNESADFEIKTSGTNHISVGIDQEIHYWTTDEYETITEGSQSYKYYISPEFKVYDLVKGYSSYGDLVKLAKTDKDTGEPIAGAVYNVYKEDGTLYLGEQVTDENGIVEPAIAEKGKYYFQEAKAPEGYLLNKDKIPFEITSERNLMQWDIEIGGGTPEVTTYDGKTRETIKARDKEDDPSNQFRKATFVSSDSPDVTLGQVRDNQKLTTIAVNIVFKSFMDKFGVEQKNYTKSYKTFEEAQTDLNKIIKEKRNYGSVQVVQIADNPAEDIIIERDTTDTKIYKTSASVEKVWKDDDSSMRPKEIKISLYRDDETDSIAQAVLNEANNWKYTFKNIFSTDEHGKEFKFSMKEDKVEGYTLTDQVVTRVNDGKDWKFVLTNTRTHQNSVTPNKTVKPPTGDTTLILGWIITGTLSLLFIKLCCKKRDDC